MFDSEYDDCELVPAVEKNSKAVHKLPAHSNTKRKTTSSTNSTRTSKKAKTATSDVFGISRHDPEKEPNDSSTTKHLSSYFVYRVANGNERRTASTNGEYYIDCKVYKSADARHTDSLKVWKKALVRIKFQTDTGSHQWQKLQEFVRSADTLFESQPKIFYDE